MPDNSERCASCGQRLDAPSKQGSSSFYRRRAAAVAEGAPYRAGDLIAGRYRVQEIIGAGAVGFLFKARDEQLSLDVAVKVINSRLVQTDEEREHFASVIRTARKLSHSNLARVTDHGEDNQFPFFVAPFLEGMSLRKIIDVRISKGQVFSLAEADPIVGQVAAALAGAHKHGPHGDLKPENVIILPDLLKVTDFGLGSALPHAPFIQAQRVRKADRYFAPEILVGGPPEPRADLFGLGVMLGELLTGKTPQNGELPDLLKERPDLPSGMEGLYRRALNESVDARFQTPSEMYRELQALIRQSGARSTSVPESSMSGTRFRRTGEGPSGPGERPAPVALEKPTERVDSLPEGLRSTKKEQKQPPPDATQPFDPSLLPFLLAQKPPTDATQPLDLSMLPALPGSETQPIDSALIPAALKALSAKSDRNGEAPARSESSSTRPLKPVDATMPLGSAQLPSPPRNPDHAPTQALSAADLPLGLRNPDNAATQALDPALLPQPPSSLFASSRPSRSSSRQSSTLWLILLTAGGLVVGTGGGYALLQHLRHRTVEYATGGGTPISNEPNVAAPPPRVDDKSVLVAAGTSAGCPQGMRRVDDGPFMMGTAHDDAMRGFDERALGSVEVSRFCIDDFEFPNRPGQKPMVNVSWAEADKLCSSLGKRLCTEQEWEKACKGPDNARFPYGEKFDAKACNTEDPGGEERELAASGKFGRCQSGYGLFDLSGNVAEWTATPFASGNDKTQKGGSYDRPDYAARCSARRSGPPTSRSPQVGFRCCANAR